MLELKDYQIQAVRDLKAKIKKQLNLQVRRKNIILTNRRDARLV